jgi:enoyl-CoA hydratase
MQEFQDTTLAFPVFQAFETLRTEVFGSVLTVTLNRPEARNAMSLRMCEEIVQLFDQLRFEPQLRAIVLRAQGSVFCAGVDIREVASNEVAWVSMRRNRGIDAFLAIERCPLPVIAAVQGPALGAGCEIAGACDFIISSENAYFQWVEALRGGVGATQRLPRAVGQAMAKELLFTARKVPAQEAKTLGYVNRVVPAIHLDDAVRECTNDIEACGPLAIRLIKQAINLGETLDRNTAVDVERQLIEHSLAHNEWRERIAEYAPKS